MEVTGVAILWHCAMYFFELLKFLHMFIGMNYSGLIIMHGFFLFN